MSTVKKSNWSRKYIKRQERMLLLWKQLMATYPIFRQYKTLKVGFKSDLIDAVHNNHLFSEESVYIIEMFLARYTNSDKYLKNALKFKMRYDLQGDEVEPISKKDIAYYARMLKEHNKRKAINKENSSTRESDIINKQYIDRPLIKLNKVTAQSN